jgi:hypothetical protein
MVGFTVNQQTGGGMPKVPYFGVTDFQTREQVLQAKACIPAALHRKLHVGAMTSRKVVRGIPTRLGWEKIWLNAQGLQALFCQDDEVMNTLHYADLDDPNETTLYDLTRACAMCGPHLHALQMDMIWTRQDIISDLKENFPGLEVILQVSSMALTHLDMRGIPLPKMLSTYVGVADRILIDMSVGRGVPLNPGFTLELLKETTQIFSEESHVVGGGLGPYTFERMEQVFERHPTISTDMQGQMRSSGNATDPVEMDRVCTSLRGLSSLLLK